MARFVFELEVVLEQRRRREEDRQRALAQLQTQQQALLARIGEIQAQMGAGREQLREVLRPGSGALALDRVRLQATSGLHSVVLLQRAAIELAGLNKRVENARGELLKATIARKAIETLRERRYRAWKQEQDRREAAALDDLNVMRAARDGGAAGAELATTGSNA